jgi:two-component system, NtrC family, response regulator HydG
MVLIVDDDPGVRGLYVAVLRQAGADVMSSGIASEAVELSDLQAPDVVLTDLDMPTHDGIWLLREFKSRMPAIPVVLVSGYVDESRRGHLFQLGFADILMKPLSLSELATTVARVVGR